jgi:hypothetical protein
MHKRVEFKESTAKKTIHIDRGNTNHTDQSSIHGSKSNTILVSRADSFKKYKPLISALPQNLPNPPTMAERIRAAKRLKMTRRDITEQRIIRNILMHNDPGDIQNFEVLYVSNKKNRKNRDNVYQQDFDLKTRNRLPSVTQTHSIKQINLE